MTNVAQGASEQSYKKPSKKNVVGKFSGEMLRNFKQGLLAEMRTAPICWFPSLL